MPRSSGLTAPRDRFPLELAVELSSRHVRSPVSKTPYLRVLKTGSRPIASYGKQLGILTDALLTLAGDDTTHPEIQRLRDIAEKIEERKQTHRADLEQNAKAALERLKDADSEAFKRMLSSYIE